MVLVDLKAEPTQYLSCVGESTNSGIYQIIIRGIALDINHKVSKNKAELLTPLMYVPGNEM